MKGLISTKMLSPSELALSIDRYALTVALSLYRQKKHEQRSCFEIFYRKSPSPELPGVIFAGTHFLKRFLKSVDVRNAFLESSIKSLDLESEPGFVDFICEAKESALEIESVSEGILASPNMPVITLKGKIAHLLLFEAPILSILQLASSAATTAFVFSQFGQGKDMLEMGLRRAFGPEAGAIVSYYSCLSGFRSSSNMVIEPSLGKQSIGTISHAFILAYEHDPNLSTLVFPPDFLARLGAASSEEVVARVLVKRKQFGAEGAVLSELKAFLAYAITFPDKFTGLVDTYDSLGSGFLNVLVVASLLSDAGIHRFGLRLDSGDLCELSVKIREAFRKVDEVYGTHFAKDAVIIASNDINLDFLKKLQHTPNELDKLGIGTNLSTFSILKPIGFVFKLSEIDSFGVSKNSNEIKKSYLPFSKVVYKASKGESRYVVVAGETERVGAGVQMKFFRTDTSSDLPEEILIEFDFVERILRKEFANFDEKLFVENIERESVLFKKEGYAAPVVLFSEKLITAKEQGMKSLKYA